LYQINPDAVIGNDENLNQSEADAESYKLLQGFEDFKFD
jgi:hypothetical protein